MKNFDFGISSACKSVGEAKKNIFSCRRREFWIDEGAIVFDKSVSFEGLSRGSVKLEFGK
jgi:hypothetical protein